MEVAIDSRSVAHPRPDDYVLSPVLAPRPADGWTTCLVECELCGVAVRCRIYSAGETQRLRDRWRLRARLSVAAIVALVALAAALLAAHLTSWPAAILFGLTFPAMAVAFLFFLRARRLTRREDGLRLAERSRDHELRWTALKFSD